MPVAPRPPPASEPELLLRAAELAGQTLQQVAVRAGVDVPDDQKRMKGWIGELVEISLGATASSRPEPDFQNIGVELKTVPVNERGLPRESTYVCNVPLQNEMGTWRDSNVRRKLARVLWVPVEADSTIPLRLRRVGCAVLWSPNREQEEVLRVDWEELTEMIGLGRLEDISSHYGRCLQIRPKAAHARVLTPSFNDFGEPARTLPRGFYLRSSFTARILGR